MLDIGRRTPMIHPEQYLIPAFLWSVDGAQVLPKGLREFLYTHIDMGRKVIDNRPPKEQRTLKRGDVREDGKIFWRYDKYCIKGENWITQEIFNKRHQKAYDTLVGLRKNKPDWNANYMRGWRKKPSNRIASNQRARLVRVLNGIVKHNHTLDLIGCTAKELKNYLASKFTDGMTWENYGMDGWHVDHIRPCASFDLADPEQQKQCFHYTNLQPLWARDNLSKGAKHQPIK